MLLWISDLRLLFKSNRFLLRTLVLILILILLFANALIFANGAYSKDYIFQEGFEIAPESYSVKNSIQTINYGNFSIRSNSQLGIINF